MTQKEFDKLIYVIHPRERIKKNQQALLENCPTDQFEFNRLMLISGLSYKTICCGRDGKHSRLHCHMANHFKGEHQKV